MAARRPIPRWVDQAEINSASVAQFAALVDDTTDATQKVKLPTAAKSLRYHGIMTKGQMPGVTPAVGDKVDMQKTGRAYTLLAGINGGSAKAVLPGDWAVIHNALGHTSPYQFGSGTALLLGMYRTKYTNSEATAGVPVEMDQHPQLIVQTEVIRGGADTIAASNTRNLTLGGAENNGDYILFTAPWDGTLRGFRLDLEPGVGPAGLITAVVRTRAPGGAWATAQVGGADWSLSLDAAAAVSAEDTIATDALASTKSLAIVKGTKVGIQCVKDGAVANITQLRGRLIFY